MSLGTRTIPRVSYLQEVTSATEFDEILEVFVDDLVRRIEDTNRHGPNEVRRPIPDVGALFPSDPDGYQVHFVAEAAKRFRARGFKVAIEVTDEHDIFVLRWSIGLDRGTVDQDCGLVRELVEAGLRKKRREHGGAVLPAEADDSAAGDAPAAPSATPSATPPAVSRADLLGERGRPAGAPRPWDYTRVRAPEQPSEPTEESRRVDPREAALFGRAPPPARAPASAAAAAARLESLWTGGAYDAPGSRAPRGRPLPTPNDPRHQDPGLYPGRARGAAFAGHEF